MICRSTTLAIGLALIGSGLAAQDEPSKLPIEVPKAASVNFEAEGPGKQFLTTIRHLMEGDLTDPTAPSLDKLTIKTPFGNVDLRIEDIKPLLEKIHMLHVVSYTALPTEDPFKRYEKQFTAAGMQKVALVPGSNGALIMRHIGSSDCYGIVTRQKDSVVVLRTEGAPGLGDLGKTLFEALSRSVQNAISAKKHGSGN